jgi:WD40 repeat protein
VNVWAFSPDSAILVTGDVKKTLLVWDTRTWNLKGALDGHRDGCSALAFSPDGKLLASAGFRGGEVKLWSMTKGRPTGKLLRALRGHTMSVGWLVFSPEGTMLASGGYDSTARLWDVRTGKLLWTFKGDGPVNGVAFSPDGKTLALADKRTQPTLTRTDVPGQNILLPHVPGRGSARGGVNTGFGGF